MPGPTYEEYQAEFLKKQQADPYSASEIEKFKARQGEAGFRPDEVQENVKSVAPKAKIGPVDYRKQTPTDVPPTSDPWQTIDAYSKPSISTIETGGASTGPSYEEFVQQELAKNPQTTAQKTQAKFEKEHPILNKALDVGKRHVDTLGETIAGFPLVEPILQVGAIPGNFVRGAIGSAIGGNKFGAPQSPEELGIQIAGGQEKWDLLDRAKQSAVIGIISILDPAAWGPSLAKVLGGKTVAPIAKKMAEKDAAIRTGAERDIQATQEAAVASAAKLKQEQAIMNEKAVAEAKKFADSKMVSDADVTKAYDKISEAVTKNGNPRLDATPYLEHLKKLKLNETSVPATTESVTKKGITTEKVKPHPSDKPYKQVREMIDADIKAIVAADGKMPFSHIRGLIERYGKLGSGTPNDKTGMYKSMQGALEDTLDLAIKQDVAHPEVITALKSARELYKKQLAGEQVADMFMDATPLKGTGVTEGKPVLDKLKIMNDIRTDKQLLKRVGQEEVDAMISTLRKIEVPDMKATIEVAPKVAEQAAGMNPIFSALLKEGVIKTGQAIGVPRVGAVALGFLLTRAEGRKVLEAMAKKGKGSIRPSAIIAAAEAMQTSGNIPK